MTKPAPSPALRGAALLLAACLLAPAHAADKDGRFGVKGAGAAKCSAFERDYSQKAARLATYGGWIDGFLTGVNHAERGLFEIAPWQSNEVIAYALADYCRKHPDHSFFHAMLALKQTLAGKALTEFSPIVVAKRDGKAVAIYEIVLRQLRERLKATGHLSEVPQSAKFERATSDALMAYQKEAGITQNGLPDQITLSRLLR